MQGVSTGSEVFTPEEFSLGEVLVVDREGHPLNFERDGEQFFEKHVVNNRAVPEPAMALQLAAGVVGLTLLDHLRRRKEGRA